LATIRRLSASRALHQSRLHLSENENAAPLIAPGFRILYAILMTSWLT
jgi:hypothetical protein